MKVRYVPGCRNHRPRCPPHHTPQVIDDKDHESLKTINYIRSAIRPFVKPLHGVSTKWLGLHFKWVHGFERSEDKALRKVNLGDCVHRWGDMNLMPLSYVMP